MSFEPFFLTLEDVFIIHKKQIDTYGGLKGIRDRGLLESALVVPQSTFDGVYSHKNLFDMAAAYAFHISQNQPFLDGNKRTALASALIFLDMNGVEINDPKQRLYQAMIDIAEGKIKKTDLAVILERLAKK